MAERQARYRTIRAALQAEIEGPGYAPGDRIPAERELAARFGASRMTVRRAIDDLIRAGLLERDSTNGTFVRQPRVTRPMGGDVLGVTQMLRGVAGTPATRLLRFGVEPADAATAARLAVGPGEPLLVLTRLRLIGRAPFALETSALPRMLVPDLAAEDIAEASLYDVLRGRYGINPCRAEETVTLARAGPEEADALGLPEDAPILLLRAVVFDARGQPVEALVSANHPERVAFGVAGPPADAGSSVT